MRTLFFVLILLTISSCSKSQLQLFNNYFNSGKPVDGFGNQQGYRQYNISTDHIDEEPPGYTVKDTSEAMAILPNGSILLAGKTRIESNGNSSSDIYIAKVSSSGSLDLNFADQGYYKFDRGNYESIGDVIYSNGWIYMVGSSRSGTTADSAQLLVTKLSPEGIIDNSFGTNGNLFIDLNDGRVQAKRAIKSSGGGLFVVALAKEQSDSSTHYYTLKINEDGNLDNNFSSDGISELPITSGTTSSLGFFDTIEMDSANNLFVAGTAWDASNSVYIYYITKLLSNGAVDLSFGENGLVVGNSPNHQIVEDLLIHESFIYLPIVNYNPADGYSTELIRRSLTDGELDSSFNNNSGKITFNNRYLARIDKSNGKFILAGATFPPGETSSWSHSYVKFSRDGTQDFLFGDNGAYENFDFTKNNSIRDVKINNGFIYGTGYMLNQEINDQVIFLQKLHF